MHIHKLVTENQPGSNVHCSISLVSGYFCLHNTVKPCYFKVLGVEKLHFKLHDFELSSFFIVHLLHTWFVKF
jgi:hypothetical protein